MQSDPNITAPVTLTGTEQRYWHKDHLGSIVASTNANLTVTERLAYEPFGKRRFTTGQFDPTGTIDAQTTSRGFTGHEHLDGLDFIHMNARVYDPDIGRFLSPDPTVPYAHNPQSFNRYSYSENNPLNFVDPTGFTNDPSAGAVSKNMDAVESSFSNSSSVNTKDNLSTGESSGVGPTKGLDASPSSSSTKGGDEMHASAKRMLRGRLAEEQLLEGGGGGFGGGGGGGGARGSGGSIGGGKPSGSTGGGGASSTKADTLTTNKAAKNSEKNFDQRVSNEKKDTDAYLGIDPVKKTPDYTGISKNVDKRAAQHGDRFTNLEKVTNEKLARSEARGVEQAIKNANPEFQNVNNSIAPTRSWYQDAVNWGEKYLIDNGLGRLIGK